MAKIIIIVILFVLDQINLFQILILRYTHIDFLNILNKVGTYTP